MSCRGVIPDASRVGAPGFDPTSFSSQNRPKTLFSVKIEQNHFCRSKSIKTSFSGQSQPEPVFSPRNPFSGPKSRKPTFSGLKSVLWAKIKPYPVFFVKIDETPFFQSKSTKTGFVRSKLTKTHFLRQNPVFSGKINQNQFFRSKSTKPSKTLPSQLGPDTQS